MKKILAIIPARFGSKGLPGKNIKLLHHKPLISYTIEASLNSKYISKTIVSSDSDDILQIAKNDGAIALKRPSSLSTDTSSSQSVVRHVLDELNKVNEVFDYLILLQPTSPLRNTQNINEAIEKLLETKATALISVSIIENKILKAFIENKDGYIDAISNSDYPFMPRQNLPNTYISNGAIYIIDIKEFNKKNTFYTNKTIAYVMNERNTKDIDTIEEFKAVEEELSNTKV